MEEKKEYTTYLRGNVVVDKTDARITFRGSIDGLVASLVRLQVEAAGQGKTELVDELEEVRTKLYDVLYCEVQDKPCGDLFLWGMGSDEIRKRSHSPEKYFGLGHIRPHYTMGVLASGLNELRTESRKTELSAVRAFKNGEKVEREDIVTVLNRLSSAFYILTYKYLPAGYDKTVSFAKSAR